MQYGRIFALAAIVAIGMAAQPASAALIKSYDFNGDLTDTLGNGADLVAFGGSLGGGRYTFGNNQGLRLSSALPSTTDYTIEIKFEMTSNPTFWNKLIDFQNRGSDTGLYVGGDRLQFFNTTVGGPNAISLNTDVVVRLERNGTTGQVVGSTNGVQQWSFADGGNLGVPGGNLLHFFMDDFNTGQGETFAGSVDHIRIFDSNPDPVPEPGTLALLGLGCAGFIWHRRRRSRQ